MFDGRLSLPRRFVYQAFAFCLPYATRERIDDPDLEEHLPVFSRCNLYSSVVANLVANTGLRGAQGR
jgi:hypothetical protein